MQSIWEKIEEARRVADRQAQVTDGQGSPFRFGAMNPPASKLDLELLSVEIEMELPSQLYDSLAIHNGFAVETGGWFHDECCGIYPMSCNSIGRVYWSMVESPFVGEKSWIPVLTDRASDYYYFIDSDDGSLLGLQQGLLQPNSLRFDSYLDFLKVVLKCIQDKRPFSWPF